MHQGFFEGNGKVSVDTYMTSMNGINNLNISSPAIRNGCNPKADQSAQSQISKGKQETIQRFLTFLLTLNIVMNRYTEEISKLAILAKLPVPKNATLNKTI